jgi:hypothetical protein
MLEIMNDLEKFGTLIDHRFLVGHFAYARIAYVQFEKRTSIFHCREWRKVNFFTFLSFCEVEDV